jgi:putative thiamine transport system ATP-binding protein
MIEAGLVLDRLRISLDGQALVTLDASIAPGEVLTVMGPSGAGKSSLLAALMGTLDPAFRLEGRVRLDGQELTGLPPEARRIGILFQDDLLFPHLSVGANLAFGLAPGGSRAQRRARVDAALEEIGLGGYAARDPATLSGGQKARVALMRTLLAEPRALLLDEPFSRLDAALRDRMRALVFGRAREGRLPVLMVTHDPGDAEAAAGPVVHLGAAATG